MKKRLPALLRALTWLFYILFSFYWFKDNIPALKSVPGRPLVPFLLLVAVILARLVPALRTKKIRLRPGRDAVLLLALILLAVAVRVPYFVQGGGILTSDDAIPALMGKHIADGKIAPISYYGQLYMGSLSSHVFALFFKCFGYSLFMLQLTTLLFYLGFMAVEFVFLKELFSREFAALVVLFFALPIGELVRVSFDDTSAYPLVLLFGALLLFLSYRIAWKGEDRWLSLFGFLTGLAFWTHQVTAGFILTAWLAVLVRTKPNFKRYAVLASTTLAGLFPLLIQEAYDRLHMLRFLVAGKKEPMSAAKLSMTAGFLRKLLSTTDHPLGILFLGLVLLGFGVMAVRAVRHRDARPQALFALFFGLFFGVFIFSGFSAKGVIRYLFPSYACLPVLFLAGPWFLVRRRRIAASLAALAVLLAFNLGGAFSAFQATRTRSLHLRAVVAAMEATGVKYWQAEYWTAYKITAVAGERVVVDAYTMDRYFPFRLDYFNRARRGAFVFMKDSTEASKTPVMVGLLKKLGVPFHYKDVGGTGLIFGLESQVFTPLLFGGIIKDSPPGLPALRLEEAATAKGYLRLSFRTDAGGEPPPGFQVQAEIPPYCSQTRNLSPKPEDNRFKLALPKKAAVRADYFLDYCGLKIPSSVRTVSLSLAAPGAARRKERIVFLSGLGPKTTFFGPEMRVLEKEVRVELNRLKKRKTRLRLTLYSPFEFEHTFWYGDYKQRLAILINGKPCAERTLRDKDNALEIEIDPVRIQRGRNLVALKFEYHLPLIFAPFNLTACLLETIAVEQDPS